MLTKLGRTKEVSSNLDDLLKDAQQLYSQQISTSTARVYASDWKIFTQWCEKNNLNSKTCLPQHIALFLTHEFKAGLNPTTIQRRLAAIRFWFVTNNLTPPTEHHLVTSVMKGIRRDKTAKPKKSKKPAVVNILKKMVDTCSSSTLRDARDRALLLLGFAGGYRRSELIAIDIEDITFNENGMDIALRYSKTDQEGTGTIKAILNGNTSKYCPVQAIKNWITLANLSSGPLFRGITKTQKIRSERMAVDVLFNVMKRCALHAGLNFEDYSPHSLRSGFATSAIENSAKITKVMNVTKHKSLKSLQHYVLHTERYDQHPAEGLL